MLSILATIAPIFLLIVFGYGFKRTGFPGNGLWQPAERLAYYVLLPALLIYNLSRADLSGLPVGRIAATLISLALVMTVLVVAIKPLLRIDPAAFTSVVQGVVRLNAYMGFAVAAAFFGAPGLTIAAVMVAIMMPTVNLISIAALAVWKSTGRPSWKRVAMQIATNPLILACAFGALLNIFNLPPPDWIMGVLKILSGAALPLALLCIGAGLDLEVGRARGGVIALTCGLKLVVMPAAAYLIAESFGLTGLAFTVIVMFTGTAGSPAAYILARQLGGDAPLMAGILTAETALTALTLPLILALLM